MCCDDNKAKVSENRRNTVAPIGRRERRVLLYRLLLIILPLCCTPASSLAAVVKKKMTNRKLFLERFAAAGVTLLFWSQLPPTTAFAFSPQSSSSSSTLTTINGDFKAQSTVAYKQLSLSMDKFGGVTVPVACWFPMDASSGTTTAASPAYYQHRISVRRIGQLLAGWDFIPEFVSKNYKLSPSSVTAKVVDVGRYDAGRLPAAGPVVLLAHGYLGSRFDLSHLAEELACAGFICVAAEYPESLAASYERQPGLDRSSINAVLLDTLKKEWKLEPSTTAYGIVGHSLGCGTVLQTGDETWARVSIAGFPRNRDGSAIPGNGLLLASMNDGAVSLARIITGGSGSGSLESVMADCKYEMLQENNFALNGARRLLPRRAALVFDRPDAPNHISFLSEGVNDAMIEFLSPLLPVAQAFNIPVLDFDRYQVSRDSVATAAAVHPVIVQYLKQEMVHLQRKN